MYPRNDKRRLYQLMEMYLANVIVSSVFCDEFYYCYCLRIDIADLTEKEKQLFEEIEEISSRFSPYEEDHKMAPNAYTTEKELYGKVAEVQKMLGITYYSTQFLNKISDERQKHKSFIINALLKEWNIEDSNLKNKCDIDISIIVDSLAMDAPTCDIANFLFEIGSKATVDSNYEHCLGMARKLKNFYKDKLL